MIELPREKYLSRIRPFYHADDLIKVITGVRRSGKSTVLRQIMDEVSAEPGVSIAYLDLDSRENIGIRTPEQLMREIDRILPPEGEGRFLFIDEIQNVEGFETVVNAYRGEGVSTFITGSNSYLLSGELVTKLTGRYLEFDILPFSFSEVRDFKAINGLDFDPAADFRDYIVNGGFPRRFSFSTAEGQEKYVRDLVAEVIDKDILLRNRVRDREAFEKVLGYVLSTPGATISSPSISDYLRSQKVNVKPDTVNRYLRHIFSSRLASRCDRFDITGKRAMATLYKVYLADPALHTYYGGRRSGTRTGAMLENVVYNELVSRGYDVSVGKLGSGEVDFVVSRGDRLAYVQVAYVMESDQTVEREFGPLLRIRDAYPKYVISMDPLTSDVDGVRHLNLLDFLLGDGFALRAGRGRREGGRPRLAATGVRRGSPRGP